MAARAQGGVICDSAALAEAGAGVRFTLGRGGVEVPAFAVRYRGVVHAYLNRCAHRGVELDWNPGEFFNGERDALVCATHGACYAPDTGACIGGPCRGGGLVKLAVIEKNSRVFLQDDDGASCAPSDHITGKDRDGQPT